MEVKADKAIVSRRLAVVFMLGCLQPSQMVAKASARGGRIQGGVGGKLKGA